MKAKTYALSWIVALSMGATASAQEQTDVPATPEAAQSTGEPTAPLQGNTPAETRSETTQSTAAAVSPSTGDTSWIDDQKIDQFANAYMEVRTIQSNAATQLQTATDPAKADEVKSGAETAMIAAVERSGLKVEEFNQIVQAAAADENVRTRLDAKLQERSTGPTAQ